MFVYDNYLPSNSKNNKDSEARNKFLTKEIGNQISVKKNSRWGVSDFGAGITGISCGCGFPCGFSSVYQFTENLCPLLHSDIKHLKRLRPEDRRIGI